MAKYKLSRQSASKCLNCEWRNKEVTNEVMCPKISCVKERIEESNKLRNVRHKQAQC